MSNSNTGRMPEHLNGTEIAIIGMAGRFPGASNVDAYWCLLRDGVEAIRFFDAEAAEDGPEGAPPSPGANFVRAAAVIDGFDLFDASFFGLSHKEAEITDPQHRLFLECAWEALENASYDGETFPGAVGVYGGATINTYLLSNLASNPELVNSLDPLQLNIGNGGDFLTTRVSYKLNLKGPSHLVQSACSTSLVAVHIACQSLLNEECDMALAGGVSVNLRNQNGYYYQEGGIVSPDGHCRAFDAKAQGTIFGSGVGVVVLKRLEDALADGDTVHAVIKGSAINNDGSVKIGYTAPSVEGQAEVITEALSNAGVPPDSISYVETHGTGTPLGDPVEIRALTKAFRQGTAAAGFCAIGSVKTNIGHLDAAAGVASLIKTVLALKHRQLPPSLHFEEPNPQIDFGDSPFYVNTRLREWNVPSSGLKYPRRAGVSSFGVGGTNAHVIVEEAPEVEPTGGSRRWQLLVLSAKTEVALERVTGELAGWLGGEGGAGLADAAYTLAVGRRGFEHRRVAVCGGAGEASEALETLDPRRVWSGRAGEARRSVVFMFPGQGAQYARMGADIYADEKVFGREIDNCAKLLKPHLGLDLRELLYPSGESQSETAEERLKQTWLTQPALFVTEYALAKLWMSYGVKPEAMIGHSIGEYVAACLSGVFSLEDALKLVAARGRMVQSLPEGAMLGVRLSETELQGLLGGTQISVAAINAPSTTVVSGPTQDVKELERQLSGRGIICRLLDTSHAFHSAMMEPAVEQFVKEVKSIRLKPPQIPYISNVTGTWITAEEATRADYWGRHLRQAVRFSAGLETLFEESNRMLLEVGPGQTLSKLARRHPGGGAERVVLASMRQKESREPDTLVLVRTLGDLWLAGLTINWPEYYAGERRRRVALPTYPFERQRYWIEPKVAGGPAGEGHHGLSQTASTLAGDDSSVSENGVGAESHAPAAALHPRPNLRTVYVAPATQDEKSVAAIWQNAIGVDQIGVNDNFFELGGDSLIAIQVIAQLKERFQKEIPVVSLYEGLTIRSLVKLLDLERGEDPPAKQGAEADEDKEGRASRRKQLQQKLRGRKKVMAGGEEE